MARSKPIETLVRDDWEAPGLQLKTGIRAGNPGKEIASRKRKKRKKKARRKKDIRKKAVKKKSD